MNEENDGCNKGIDQKLMNYSRELVMLNHVYELKLITKNEMLTLKREIMEEYGIKGSL